MYDWLKGVQKPAIIREAMPLLGVREKLGNKNNPVIMSWAREVGIDYSGDDVPWCGLFAAVVCSRAGWRAPSAPLWARNWAQFGAGSPEAALGDVLVFERGTGGHVGFYVAEDTDAYHVLGGNQGDAVSISRILKTRLLAARRPMWRISKPSSVIKYIVSPLGEISTNER